ncbi:hypothetical protein NQZ68_025306 [Dissostichus eleginoides]|nr:hypothetical protein NQZ68_025306 [Dissostichus eleginoides]
MSLSRACRKSVEALHLLLDAGRLWDFDLHIQREKRGTEGKAEIQQAALCLSETETETGGSSPHSRQTSQLQHPGS